MTHDPLCPQRECGACKWEGEACCRGVCQCALISQVRADTLNGVRETVQLAAQEAAFTSSMDGLFDAVELIDSMRSDAPDAACQNHNENVMELTEDA